jgi:hypothetical protein
MTPYVSRCRRIWVIAYPWVLSLQDLVMRRTRSGEESQHARSPFLGAAPGITPPRVFRGRSILSQQPACSTKERFVAV